jgi:hypothetical protein
MEEQKNSSYQISLPLDSCALAWQQGYLIGASLITNKSRVGPEIGNQDVQKIQGSTGAG